jgi:hypothetical protein
MMIRSKPDIDIARILIQLGFIIFFMPIKQGKKKRVWSQEASREEHGRVVESEHHNRRREAWCIAKRQHDLKSRGKSSSRSSEGVSRNCESDSRVEAVKRRSMGCGTQQWDATHQSRGCREMSQSHKIINKPWSR